MPLLHRGVLLQRQRVDLAEHRQGPLAGPQPLLLLLAHERCGRGGLLPLGNLAEVRHQRLGSVVPHERVGVEAELLEGPLLQLLDPHPLLGPGHLVAVDRVDQLVVLAAEVAQPAADVEELLLTTPA